MLRAEIGKKGNGEILIHRLENDVRFCFCCCCFNLQCTWMYLIVRSFLLDSTYITIHVFKFQDSVDSDI